MGIGSADTPGRSVVQDELCPCPGVFQVHEQVPGLLHYPRLDRMLGGSEDPDAAGALLDDAAPPTAPCDALPGAWSGLGATGAPTGGGRCRAASARSCRE